MQGGEGGRKGRTPAPLFLADQLIFVTWILLPSRKMKNQGPRSDFKSGLATRLCRVLSALNLSF